MNFLFSLPCGSVRCFAHSQQWGLCSSRETTPSVRSSRSSTRFPEDSPDPRSMDAARCNHRLRASRAQAISCTNAKAFPFKSLVFRTRVEELFFRVKTPRAKVQGSGLRVRGPRPRDRDVRRGRSGTRPRGRRAAMVLQPQPRTGLPCSMLSQVSKFSKSIGQPNTHSSSQCYTRAGFADTNQRSILSPTHSQAQENATKLFWDTVLTVPTHKFNNFEHLCLSEA